jgi:hypothetical protein
VAKLLVISVDKESMSVQISEADWKKTPEEICKIYIWPVIFLLQSGKAFDG